ncbi:MAG: replication-relaxation family protein [Chloroflexi bacterium]|nr:replication-relaxation family protein [Chloroflexota bacterium]
MDGGQPRRAGDLDETSTTHTVAPAVLRATAATAEKRCLSHGTAPRAISVARRPVWRDAERAAAGLTQAERDTLTTLIRVPFATVTLLEQLGGLCGGAAVYRRLARLRAAGLVGEVRPLIQPRYSPALLYITDLGLATVAVGDRRDPVEIARRFRARGSDLLGRLPGLPTLLASYHLLGALARAGPGWPRLLSWEQPCRRCFQRPTAKAPSRLELPAHASLAWDDQGASYLLIPDLGTSHLRIYRPMLHQLHALRRAVGDASRLVIATDSRRAGAWEALLEDIARSRRDAPLRAWIARWTTLDPDLEKLFDVEKLKPASSVDSAELPQTPRLVVRSPDAAIPRPVGDLATNVARPRTLAARLGRLALDLMPSDAKMLDVVSRHPFLPLHGVATTLGWSTSRTRQRRDDLIRRGLARLLPANTSRGVTLELAELTVDGLRLAASRLGFPLSVAVEVEGLAGGGPAEPIGDRQSLVKNLTHTLGANAVFTHLQSSAARGITQGGDDLVLWDGPGACGRGRVRPDGHGVYRRGGQLCHFFLEYDRGTSGGRRLVRKLNAYYEYLETGRFRRDYPYFPIVLVVTTSNAAERRFARAARAASVGRYTRLPLLLTATWRIFDDPNNPDGLLGPIWREPDAPFDRRRRWIENTPAQTGGERRSEVDR